MGETAGLLNILRIAEFMGLFEIPGVRGVAGEEWKDAQGEVLEPLNIYGIAKRECKEIIEGHSVNSEETK